MDSEDIIRSLVTMQADIRELSKVNDEQDEEINRLRERVKKYDTMAAKAWGIGLGVIAAGVIFSSSVEAIRNKLLGILMP